jgi:phosphoenolpyruvate-protein phosphotransferase
MGRPWWPPRHWARGGAGALPRTGNARILVSSRWRRVDAERVGELVVQTGDMKTYKGIAASGGVAVGPAFLYHPRPLLVDRMRIGADEVAAEMSRWQAARRKAAHQLAEIQAHTEDAIGQANSAIFEAQAMMLEDPALLELVETKILRERYTAPAAVDEAATFHADAIAALSDARQRERAADVRDVAQRVMRLLLDVEESPWANLLRPAVVVARDLTPTDMASMPRALVLGVCTGEGGMTSHTAILARASGLPAVLGIGATWEEIGEGETIVVDGTQGLIVRSPDEAALAIYRAPRQSDREADQAVLAAAREAAVSSDGRRVEVTANIDDVASAQACLEYGADGVGLLRTEFLFMDRAAPPGEEEQYQAYRSIAAIMRQRPLVIRTLDVGGDKPLPYLEQAREANPFLGCRGIRVSLAHPDFLGAQLRAILRAGVGHNIKIMLPMVSTLDEIRAAKSLISQARADLLTTGVEATQRLEIGVMVEAPAAAILSDLWAPEVDFFSVGTNDLIQYTLAVDRGNSRVAAIYDPLNPAVLRLIQLVIDTGRRHGKRVGLCGEMAGDREAIPLLLGMGLRGFSMNAAAIPAAKDLIRRLDAKALQALAEHALKVATAAEVRALVGRIW